MTVTNPHILALIPEWCWQDCQEIVTFLDSYGIHLDQQALLGMFDKWGPKLIEKRWAGRAYSRDGRIRHVYRGLTVSGVSRYPRRKS